MKILLDGKTYYIDDTREEFVAKLEEKNIKIMRGKHYGNCIKDDDVKDIKRMYYQEKMSLRAIGKRYNTSRTTVMTFMEKHGMPRTPQKLFDSMAEDVRRMYYQEKLNQKEIAKRLNTAPATVCKFMCKHGLKVKYEIQISQAQKKLLAGRDEIIRLYHGKGLNIKETAKRLQVSPTTLNKFMIENNIERRCFGRGRKKVTPK